MASADTSYTFSNTTVVFTPDQQTILDSDIKKINDETDYLNNTLYPERDRLSGQESYWDSQPPSQEKDANLKTISANRTINNSLIATAISNLDEKNPNSYTAKYNSDLVQIQNQIKIQIQAQQANENQANLNTQNLNYVPIKTQELANSQAKEIETRKYIFAGFVVIVVIIGFLIVIKKIL